MLRCPKSSHLNGHFLGGETSWCRSMNFQDSKKTPWLPVDGFLRNLVGYRDSHPEFSRFKTLKGSILAFPDFWNSSSQDFTKQNHQTASRTPVTGGKLMNQKPAIQFYSSITRIPTPDGYVKNSTKGWKQCASMYYILYRYLNWIRDANRTWYIPNQKG